MKLRILTENDCRALVGMADAIDIQAEAFTLLAEGKSVEGLRSLARSESPPGVVIFNPSFLTQGQGHGIKVVSDYYGNEDKGVPRLHALVALFDGETGRPTTVMEAGYLTDLRTGAGTGLAARYLARRDSGVMAVIGAGRVARNQVEGLCSELEISEIRVATRTAARGEAFVERMRRRGPPIPDTVELSPLGDEAVDGADVVVCATTAVTPVFDGSRLSEGAFVVAAGAYAPENREVDSETIRRASKWVIDSRADCLANAGDLMIPIGEGLLREDQVAQIAEVIAGARPGREDEREITYYKSSGVPIQDLITAQHIENRAIAADIGTLIEIGGDHD